MIRSLFLLLFVIWVMALGTLASCGQAGADPLPDIYLGKWCQLTDDEKSAEQIYFRDDGKCPEEDILTIEHTRYHGWEFGCRYISIKHTGEKLPASTKPTKEDGIPVVRISARCEAEGEESSNPEFILGKL